MLFDPIADTPEEEKGVMCDHPCILQCASAAGEDEIVK